MDTLQRSRDESPNRSMLLQFGTAPFRQQTYRNIAYLFLQFPLSITYFVTLVTVGATGLAAITILTEAIPDILSTMPVNGIGLLTAGIATIVLGIISLPLLVLGVVGLVTGGVGLFTVDRFVSEVLLGQSFPQRPLPYREFDTTREFVSTFLTSSATYLSLAAVLIKFPIGIATFVVLVVSSTVSVVFTAAPFLYDSPASQLQFRFVEGASVGHVDGFYTIDFGVILGTGTWTIDTFPEAVVLSAVGLLTALIALNGLNFLAWVLAEATAIASRNAFVFTLGSSE